MLIRWLLITLLAVLFVCTLPPAFASSGDVALDVNGAAGQELWRLNSVAGGAGVTRVTPDGCMVFAGEMYGEASATTTRQGILPANGYVFEAKIALSGPPLLVTPILFVSPRVTGADGAKGYRIEYCFESPRVANNQTGFFLVNTGVKDSKPIAGKRYKLVAGREYTTYSVVRDVAEGVRVQFYVHNPQFPDDDKTPLFDFVHKSPDRIAGGNDARVQIGTTGLYEPALPVSFRDMKVYPLDEFDAVRANRKDDINAAPPAGTFVAERPASKTELPNFFSDNMVLQRDKPLPIWGHGIEGDEIHVTLAGKEARTRVSHGNWMVKLDPIPAGGPYVLTVQGKDKTIEIKNVLMGDVWVLGGQSNMSYWLKDCVNAEQEIAQSDCMWLRVFASWHPSADEPQFSIGGGNWKVVTHDIGGAFSAVGYFLARAIHEHQDVPIGLVDTSIPATPIEVWLDPASVKSLYKPDRFGQYPDNVSDPSVCYYGKVAPDMPAAITGIAWYQGDGSTPETGLAYRKRIPALIDGWRKGFGQGDVPFLVVQIPRFNGCSPQMRESDLLGALSRKNTGVAVVLDIGEPDNIHPHNKKPVGQRLGLIARALAYGEKIEYMGPIYRSMKIEGGKAYLSFDHASSGLILKGDDAFEICGADGKYVKANALVDADNRLVVWSTDVSQPTNVRYAWANFPQINLYNKEGLLASPFRTDALDLPEAKLRN